MNARGPRPTVLTHCYHWICITPYGMCTHSFAVSPSTVTRAVRRYREQGEAGFRQRRRWRGRVVLDAGRAREAEALLARGISGSAAARRLGVPVSTFNENRRAGVIGGGEKTRGSSRNERDSRDREAPMGRATHDVAGRVLAMTGQMEEARPTFGGPAHGVAGAWGPCGAADAAP